MMLLHYLLLTSAYALVLWGIYALTLRNSPQLRASRIFLLAAICISPLLPLLQLPKAVLPEAAFTLVLPAFSTGTGAGEAPSSDTGPWIYAVVSGLFMVWTGASYIRIRLRLLQSPSASGEGYTLLRGTGMGPGTLGRLVFIPGASVVPAVLRHELAHIRAGHRYDLVVLSICRCLLWASPAHWILARELRAVHEFEADRMAAHETSDVDYGALLVSGPFGVRPSAFSQYFFQHPIKRRIMMLQNTAIHGAGKKLVAAVVLSAAFASGAVIAQTKRDAAGAPAVASRTPLDREHLMRTYGQPVPGTVSQTPDGRIMLSKVERMPQFDGNLGQWLLANVRSPEKEMQGKTVVQFTVDADGNVTAPALTQASGNPRLDAEALRVVRSMPKWKPGLQNGVAVPVLVTLPFMFGSIGAGC